MAQGRSIADIYRATRVTALANESKAIQRDRTKKLMKSDPQARGIYPSNKMRRKADGRMVK